MTTFVCSSIKYYLHMSCIIILKFILVVYLHNLQQHVSVYNIRSQFTLY